MVLRALGLGDLLTGLPALRALRRSFPDELLLLAAPAPLAPLVHRAGVADRVVDVRGLRQLPPELRRARLAVNLHGRGPESTRLLHAAAPREVIAFGDGAAWREDEHEVVRWCRLLLEHGIPAAASLDALRLPPPAMPTDDLVGVTVVHPGAASGSRRWPPERFADVAAAERNAGRQVVVTGSAAELGLALRVAASAGLPRTAVLAGRTPLPELSRVIAWAGRVVCGDTGVAHLATAHGTPSVVLFGPVPPSAWGPLPGGPHRALWAGRRGDPHADELDPGLAAIGVDDVLRALETLS